MLNRTGITKTSYGNVDQILANVDLQASVGCIVAQAVGIVDSATGKRIAHAGTPITLNFGNLQIPVTEGQTKNAVLLHDVDVTAGNANGTALYFGIVNINRVTHAATKAKLTAGTDVGHVMVINA